MDHETRKAIAKLVARIRELEARLAEDRFVSRSSILTKLLLCKNSELFANLRTNCGILKNSRTLINQFWTDPFFDSQDSEPMREPHQQ